MNVKLKDVASFAKGSQINGEDLLNDAKYVYLNGGVKPSGKWNDYNVESEAITISEGGNSCGYVNFMKEPFWCGAHCYFLYNVRGNKKYLYYALKSQQNRLMKLRSGACMPNIKKSDLGNFTFAYEDNIEKQEDIVRRLDHLEICIDLLQEELGRLDLLVKSRFVGMFGELRLNSMAWDEYPLGLICDKVVRYPTFYGMEYLPSGTRVIRIGNILPDGHMELDDENYVFVYDTVNEDFPETVIELNDIIMAVRGDGSAAKRIGIVTEPNLIDANISPNLIRIKVNNAMLNPIYMFYYLTGEVGQKRLDAYVNKTAKKNIAAKDIVKIVTPVPPLPLQNDFAAFVREIDKSKFCV